MTNEELIILAAGLVGRREIDETSMGSVGCALITDKGTIFTGVNIDTNSGMGFCAEHNAIGTMITEKEYQIKKIVAVWKDEDGNTFVIPPCGRCREFIYRTNPKNLETDVILDKNKTVKLKELLPYYDWWQKQD